MGDFAVRLHDGMPGVRVTAVDWSAAGIELARQERGARDIDYVVADARRLPLASDSQDLVTCASAGQADTCT